MKILSFILLASFFTYIAPAAAKTPGLCKFKFSLEKYFDHTLLNDQGEVLVSFKSGGSSATNGVTYELRKDAVLESCQSFEKVSCHLEIAGAQEDNGYFVMDGRRVQYFNLRSDETFTTNMSKMLTALRELKEIGVCIQE